MLSVAAAVGILWWLFWAGAARQWLLTVALGGVTAGMLGNLYDRLGPAGTRLELSPARCTKWASRSTPSATGSW